ncbi:non-canonical purine NTP pyrophosphatase [Xanthomonas sacchari]|nr:non-canonical purine NTP pyrophosphatase [Xanthomonas sacchari]
MKLVLASSNAGKLEELHALLDDVGGRVDRAIHARRQRCRRDRPDLRRERAAQGAPRRPRHRPAGAGRRLRHLRGRAAWRTPGLYSARYAGEHGNAQANIDKLLDALRDVPDAQRGAHFYCVLVLLRHAEDPQPLLVEGRWRGRIAHARAGTGGHGYDPVFLDPEHGQTAAEMPLALKNRISHRALALQQLKQRLADHLAAHPAE